MSATDKQKTPLGQGEIFGVPTWKSSIPEFVPYHGQVMDDLERRWNAGEFGYDRYGSGHNTGTDQFSDEVLADHPHYALIRDAFVDRVHRILARRYGHAAKCDYEITDILCWLRILTPDETRCPWHNHHPAMISACYYIATPEVSGEGEGDLVFENPDHMDVLRPPAFSVHPQAGDFILFPSYLMHQPKPIPSANSWRVNFNMDAYVTWRR